MKKFGKLRKFRKFRKILKTTQAVKRTIRKTIAEKYLENSFEKNSKTFFKNFENFENFEQFEKQLSKNIWKIHLRKIHKIYLNNIRKT